MMVTEAIGVGIILHFIGSPTIIQNAILHSVCFVILPNIINKCIRSVKVCDKCCFIMVHGWLLKPQSTHLYVVFERANCLFNSVWQNQWR